ncbi:hypothetical protein DSM106972_078310 [Dulcicalothrix desertica PCC 7102]|uniref:Uncharacterized protein n=1 Tax=Dulcicalothrix desertica PCC 7102 TaxID=232991 RepID=A0A433UZV7_9CYAN|nr:hypothetical protein [Dulcicalothrix desertica]RUS99389.1 hypothetical protein DSM106972_078310 [Dulcicalothrix desertica PCC 7102]TWH50050.1 hypothetical protein CAL7102_04330 [Dulcicalothrix desertica PCC 7102]
MSYFFSLRGWLEAEPEKFDKATQLIESLQRTYEQDSKMGFYLQGWSWNRNPINWTAYLFYGADVTESGLELFEDTLDKLINTHLNLSGYFHAQGEDGERNLVYHITDDELSTKVSDVLVKVT